MARESSIDHRPAERDELDEIFNYDTNIDHILSGMDNNDTNANSHNNDEDNSNRVHGGRSGPAQALGIDEEIKITKQRKPVAKLDETRLTSAAGIPKLQKISKTRLKFKGKGHEFSDVALLLRTYQLWLDDLYPRAKFADGLAMIEKLGHKKTMQRLRNQWIADSKPKPPVENDSDLEDLSATPTKPGPEMAPADTSKGEANFSPDINISARSDAENTEPQGLNAQTNGEKPSDSAAGIPDDDDLDQLMAYETPGRNSFTAAPVSRDLSGREDDAFADEEDIMRDLDVW